MLYPVLKGFSGTKPGQDVKSGFLSHKPQIFTSVHSPSQEGGPVLSYTLVLAF